MKPIYNQPYGGLPIDGKFFLSSIITPPISKRGGADDLA